MRKRYGVCFSILMAVSLFLLAFCTTVKSDSNAKDITPVYDYVLDIGTYTSLDWDYAMTQEEALFNQMACYCSGAVNTTSDGVTIVGRNFDFYINHKPIFIFRTEVEGCYKTIGISTVMNDGPEYDEVLQNGLSEELKSLIPFLAVESLNEEGLYIETNMRLGEWDEEGNVLFSSSSTLDDETEPMSLQYLTLYLTQNAATVEEAIELVRSTNIYLPDSEYGMNICFLMADASGNYGVMEIADNTVYWLEGQPVQTNFYINEECNKRSNYKCGLGRFDFLMERVGQVETEEEMFKLMDSVKYSSLNDPDNALFDVRSEYVGYDFEWTDLFVLDEANREYVIGTIKLDAEIFNSMTIDELRDCGEFWWSSMTNIGNCNEKTISIRFFEDDSLTLKLGF